MKGKKDQKRARETKIFKSLTCSIIYTGVGSFAPYCCLAVYYGPVREEVHTTNPAVAIFLCFASPELLGIVAPLCCWKDLYLELGCSLSRLRWDFLQRMNKINPKPSKSLAKKNRGTFVLDFALFVHAHEVFYCPHFVGFFCVTKRRKT